MAAERDGDLVTPPSAPYLLPVHSRSPVTLRLARAEDAALIDRMQNDHHEAVGWMPAKQLESKIRGGHVIVAEDGAELLGYVISRDQYMKRDDCGIIYQLCVVPTRQRNLIGATLVKAVFDRAAYGCRLFCSWCAQTLDANYFWESLGFLPLAFRTGAETRKRATRTHIFWQRRIREGDTTPYWFPAETTGGSMRENRLVLPIPPGTHWKDLAPILLPRVEEMPEVVKAARKPRAAKPVVRSISEIGGLRFGPPVKPALVEAPKVKKKRPHLKNDPKQVAAARELRDRYLERLNSGVVLASGKYDVARPLPSPVTVHALPLQLPQAA